METNKKTFSFKELFQNKKFLVIFSIVSAFVLWLVVVINQTPTIDRSITNLSVTIDTAGTVAGELGLAEVSGNQTKVTVKVSGPAYVVANLDESDLVVTPSLVNVTSPGNYVIPLNALKSNPADEFTVVSVYPSQLSLVFDYVDTKQFTVTPAVSGVSAAAGLIAEEAVISSVGDSVITVKAARTQMEKLQSIVAVVNSQEILSETKTFDAQLKLLDKDGKELDASKYTLSITDVKVSVPISKRKTVKVVPDFINAPAGYEEFLKYTLSVKEVEIIGPAQNIDNINEVKLSAIDFYSITKKNSTFNLAPVLPDAVRILDNIESFTLKLDTSDFAETTLTVSRVVAVNNSSGFAVSLNSPVRNVKICGPRSVIRAIKAEELYAEIDLSGKAAGEYNASVVIRSTASSKLWQVGSYQASISVK